MFPEVQTEYPALSGRKNAISFRKLVESSGLYEKRSLCPDFIATFVAGQDPETRTELFSKLLSSGPSRPGRPRCQEASSLDSGERKWKKVIPISQIVRRRADGSELSYTEVQDRVMTDHFKILAGQSVAKTAFRPRRVAPNGKPFEPCPICHRLTAYSVSCIIKRDGEIFRKTVLSFKSKRCKAGSCAGKRVHAPTEPKTSVGGRVRRVST